MSDKRTIGLTKITKGWKTQFPVDAKKAIEAKGKKRFEPGDKLAWVLESNGRVYVEHA